THTHTHTHKERHTHSLSLSLSLSHTHRQTHTHTHTHTPLCRADTSAHTPHRGGLRLQHRHGNKLTSRRDPGKTRGLNEDQHRCIRVLKKSLKHTRTNILHYTQLHTNKHFLNIKHKPHSGFKVLQRRAHQEARCLREKNKQQPLVSSK